MAFPCNQFMHQEPGTNAEIKKHVHEKYGTGVLWCIDIDRSMKKYYFKLLQPELANSIENAIAIAFLSTIAIAIDKAIFQLLLLLLLLIRASSNYWHFNRNYCFTVLAWNAVFLVSKYTFWSQMHSRLNEDAFLR